MNKSEKASLETMTRISNGAFGTVWRIFTVWRNSACGWCPTLYDWSDERLGRAGGCGYCKESTVLANSLRFLFEPGSKPYIDVWGAGGTGMPNLMSVLEEHGYRLEQVHYGRTERGYTVQRLEVA